MSQRVSQDKVIWSYQKYYNSSLEEECNMYTYSPISDTSPGFEYKLVLIKLLARARIF